MSNTKLQFENDFVEQVYEIFSEWVEEDITAYLDDDTVDFDDLVEIKRGAWRDEYMGSEAFSRVVDLDEVSEVGKIKFGQEPDWNENDTRSFVLVYEMYEDIYTYFAPPDIVAGEMVDWWMMQSHYDYVVHAFEGGCDFDESLEYESSHEIVEKTFAEFESRVRKDLQSELVAENI